MKPLDILSDLDGGVILVIGTDKDYIYKISQAYPQFTFVNIVRNTNVL